MLVTSMLSKSHLGLYSPCHIQYRSKVSWQSRLETRFSILKVFKNQESRVEFQGLSFENRVSKIENRVSRIETLKEFFEDLEERFRGNDLILDNKTIAMNKTIDARLCSRKPALNVCKYSFMLCIFYKAHAARISTLKLMTRRQQTKVLAICIYSLTCQSEWVFFSLCDYNPKRVCCFDLRDFNALPKRKQTLTAKEMFFLTKSAWHTTILTCGR